MRVARARSRPLPLPGCSPTRARLSKSDTPRGIADSDKNPLVGQWSTQTAARTRRIDTSKARASYDSRHRTLDVLTRIEYRPTDFWRTAVAVLCGWQLELNSGSFEAA